MTPFPTSNTNSGAPIRFAGLTEVSLGPFQLTDADRETLIARVVERVGENTESGMSSQPTVMFSLHVGGLNLRKDHTFTSALDRADILVADGISVAALAKIAGGSGMHRHPTTDFGWELLSAIAGRIGRNVRVALVGGPKGLARRAADVMDQHDDIDVVLTEHGYHDDWASVLATLGQAQWDVLVVGMGMPHEALWVTDHLEELHGGLIVTCGGWFSHIVGDEKRAPAWMRSAGLEWVARLAQQPGRLAKRYGSGLFSTIAMIPTALRSRSAGKRQPE